MEGFHEKNSNSQLLPENQNNWPTMLYSVPSTVAMPVAIYHYYADIFLEIEKYFSLSIFLSKMVVKNKWRGLHIQRQRGESIFLFVSAVHSGKLNMQTACYTLICDA